MDKFGVVTYPGAAKLGTERENAKCPLCDQDLLPSEFTGVLLCPSHGSLPFESKDESDK